MIASWLDSLDARGWAMLVGIISNTSCALLGCYLVLRRLSLLGDAISHAVLPGIVLGYLATGTLGVTPMLLGALASGLLTTLLTESLSRYGRVSEDAGMGVVFTSLFALGVILISRFARNVHLDTDCVLYGLIEFVSIDTVSWGGVEVPRVLQSLLPALVATLAFVLLFWKELKLASFDPGMALTMGINATLMHYLLMMMVALVTVTSFSAVGSILVIAMLIVPPATAQLLTDRLPWMLFWAVLVGWIAAIAGAWLAHAWETSAAGMMAVVAGAEFTLAVFLAPQHGLLARLARTAQLSARILSEDLLAMLFRQEEKGRPGAPARVSYALCRQALGGGVAAWWVIPRAALRGELQCHWGGVSLSEKGRALARNLVRSHRLWEAFLGEHFELPLDHLHEPAERIEHYIGPALQAELASELAQPGNDPHGRRIPPQAE